MSTPCLSPNVIIREFDQTLRGPVIGGTNVLVTGFTKQGPTCDPISLASMSDYELIFGTPETKAEYYHYYSTKQVVDGGGNAVVMRLPYGAGDGEDTGEMYSALVYPFVEDNSNDVIISGYTSKVTVPASAYAPYPFPFTLEYPFSNGINAGDFLTPNLYASALAITAIFAPTDFNVVSSRDCLGYVVTEPVQVKITQAQYDTLLCGGIAWSDNLTCDKASFEVFDADLWGNAGMIVVDELKSTTSDKQAGFYVNLSDNFCLTNDGEFHAVSGVKANFVSGQNWDVIPQSDLAFTLEGNVLDPGVSVSETIEQLGNATLPTPFETPDYKDSLVVSLWRLRRTGPGQALRPVLVESYTGSLNADRTIEDPIRPGLHRTFFIEDVVNNDSQRLKVFVNPTLTQKEGWCQPNGLPAKSVRILREKAIDPDGDGSDVDSIVGTNIIGCDYADNLYSLGCYQPKRIATQKDVGNIPRKLAYCLRCVEDPDLVDLQLSIEAGLGSIWTGVKASPRSWITGDQRDNSFVYDDAVTLPITDDLGSNPALAQSNGPMGDNYLTVFNTFETWASNTRVCNGGPGVLHIADPLRWIFVQGRDCKVIRGSNKTGTDFQRAIYWPLENLYKTANSSYAATYANWVKATNTFTGQQCWLPFSGHAARLMAQVDNQLFPWFAPAGFQRGIVEGINDLAVNPRLRDRDLLNRINNNAVFFDRTYGFTVFQQQTLLKANSALRKINIRRLMLWLGENIRQTLKPFLFEQNSIFTRTQARNAITGFLETALNNQGVEDYEIVLDERNNPPESREDGCLVVDIYIKPVYAIECIKVNLRLTRLGTSFSELIQ